MNKPFTPLLLILTLLIATVVCVGQQPPTKAPTGKTPAEAAASYFPNTVLITQDNQKVKFYDDLLKDRIVVINFVFTTCTSICPPMMANLRKVQLLLGDRSKDVNFISISVDPTTDTPERLKDYANKFKIQSGWHLLTGEQANVDAVLHKLGGHVTNKNDHTVTVTLTIGNVATGE